MIPYLISSEQSSLKQYLFATSFVRNKTELCGRKQTFFQLQNKEIILWYIMQQIIVIAAINRWALCGEQVEEISANLVPSVPSRTKTGCCNSSMQSVSQEGGESNKSSYWVEWLASKMGRSECSNVTQPYQRALQITDSQPEPELDKRSDEYLGKGKKNGHRYWCLCLTLR